MNRKSIFDYKFVKSVSVAILVDKETKDVAGKIISNWSDNPAGTVCTSQVILWEPQKYGITPKREPYSSRLLEGDYDVSMIGKAGGYGYCKLSSSIATAINDNTHGDTPPAKFGGVGESGIRDYFDAIGLTYSQVL